MRTEKTSDVCDYLQESIYALVEHAVIGIYERPLFEGPMPFEGNTHVVRMGKDFRRQKIDPKTKEPVFDEDGYPVYADYNSTSTGIVHRVMPKFRSIKQDAQKAAKDHIEKIKMANKKAESLGQPRVPVPEETDVTSVYESHMKRSSLMRSIDVLTSLSLFLSAPPVVFISAVLFNQGGEERAKNYLLPFYVRQALKIDKSKLTMDLINSYLDDEEHSAQFKNWYNKLAIEFTLLGDAMKYVAVSKEAVINKILEYSSQIMSKKGYSSHKDDMYKDALPNRPQNETDNDDSVDRDVLLRRKRELEVALDDPNLTKTRKLSIRHDIELLDRRLDRVSGGADSSFGYDSDLVSFDDDPFDPVEDSEPLYKGEDTKWSEHAALQLGTEMLNEYGLQGKSNASPQSILDALKDNLARLTDHPEWFFYADVKQNKDGSLTTGREHWNNSFQSPHKDEAIIVPVLDTIKLALRYLSDKSAVSRIESRVSNSGEPVEVNILTIDDGRQVKYSKNDRLHVTKHEFYEGGKSLIETNQQLPTIDENYAGFISEYNPTILEVDDADDPEREKDLYTKGEDGVKLSTYIGTLIFPAKNEYDKKVPSEYVYDGKANYNTRTKLKPITRYLAELGYPASFAYKIARVLPDLPINADGSVSVSGDEIKSDDLHSLVTSARIERFKTENPTTKLDDGRIRSMVSNDVSLWVKYSDILFKGRLEAYDEEIIHEMMQTGDAIRISPPYIMFKNKAVYDKYRRRLEISHENLVDIRDIITSEESDDVKAEISDETLENVGLNPTRELRGDAVILMYPPDKKRDNINGRTGIIMDMTELKRLFLLGNRRDVTDYERNFAHGSGTGLPAPGSEQEAQIDIDAIDDFLDEIESSPLSYQDFVRIYKPRVAKRGIEERVLYAVVATEKEVATEVSRQQPHGTVKDGTTLNEQYYYNGGENQISGREAVTENDVNPILHPGSSKDERFDETGKKIKKAGGSRYKYYRAVTLNTINPGVSAEVKRVLGDAMHMALINNLYRQSTVLVYKSLNYLRVLLENENENQAMIWEDWLEGVSGQSTSDNLPRIGYLRDALTGKYSDMLSALSEYKTVNHAPPTPDWADAHFTDQFIERIYRKNLDSVSGQNDFVVEVNKHGKNKNMEINSHESLGKLSWKNKLNPAVLDSLVASIVDVVKDADLRAVIKNTFENWMSDTSASSIKESNAQISYVTQKVLNRILQSEVIVPTQGSNSTSDGSFHKSTGVSEGYEPKGEDVTDDIEETQEEEQPELQQEEAMVSA